ncbi:MAG: RHS repeat domain-containing protein [Pyrinomonadaceae bacterium]
MPGVLGYKYYYDDFNEHTGRVTFAQHITGQNPALDRTQTSSGLDRSYEYDHLGRLAVSHAGAEARAHAFSGQWGVWDGHYSQGYDYDAWGNMTHRYGWGGDVLNGAPPNLQTPPTSADLYYSYATGSNGVVNNRRAAPFVYDNAGNLTSDGVQNFTYDVQGNQVTASVLNIEQGYDGEGRRVRRDASGMNSARYLRSSVLGGQVVAEINYVNSAWQFARGYVYSSMGLLAMQQAGTPQQGGGIYFIHEDPVTKGKRVTNSNGGGVSTVEFDPFGAEANGSNSAFQPRKFTTYERDPNGTDEAMFRRYNRRDARFDQPDPYHGSYDFADPQSLNRYAYTENDPVNFNDPSGLMPCNPIDSPRGCGEGWDVMTWGQIMRDFARHEYWGGYSPQDRVVNLPDNLKERVEKRVNNSKSDCANFIRQLIEEAARIAGDKAYSTDAMKNFNRIQGEGGFHLKEQNEKGTANFTGGGKRLVNIKPVTAPDDQRKIENTLTNYAGTALGEVLHHARDGGVYNDRLMAKATYNSLSKDEQKAHPLPSTDDQGINSRYWHPLLLGHCPAPE